MVQGTSSRSKDTAKQVGPSAETAESRVDNNKEKGSRSLGNHAAMRADVQDQPSSALDRIHSAVNNNIACKA